MDVFRRPFVVLLHLGLIALSNELAFLLRFEGHVPYPQAPLVSQFMPWLLLVRGAVFVPFRLYEGLWRYTSIWDLRNILAGVGFSSVIFYLLVHHVFGAIEYSRSIFIIDAILLVCFMGGVRLTRRIHLELGRRDGRKRVLVYGAGDAGELIVRDMRNTHWAAYEPIGFIDDDRNKVGRRIHGIPVLGTRANLPAIVKRRAPHEVLVAIPTADAATMRDIVRALEQFNVKITTLPSLREILDGRVTVSQIRNLAPEDLLGRGPIGLDHEPVRRFIKGRRVMVTGAGGSIGSELCNQIAGFSPAKLVLLERYENSLFAITNQLTDREYGAIIAPVMGDVTDAARINAVLAEHQPDIVFHAAAHKHVPLMEQNPCEAIKNNVTGTRLLAEAAERHGVDRFVLISTDKAVNPTSVMGASKRVAELMVQTRARGSGTSFLATRFGNVLASNGSVVPRFLDQIRAGGPVTVTHPEMRRYFMLIPEAVELVLQAAARGEDGQIYVLEMGEQIKVLDMARNLIRLSGLVAEEIPITFVGLRPGEKLEEELIGSDEIAEPSDVPKVLKVRPRVFPDAQALAREVAALEAFAVGGRTADVFAGLKRIVPEFAHTSAAVQEEHSAVERRPVAPAQRSPVRLFAQVCPDCRSTDVHRSKPYTVRERLRRSMTEANVAWFGQTRLFRCHACGWRGWLVPMERIDLDGEARSADAPDLTSLDASIQGPQVRSRSVFTPRDLQDLK